MPLGARRSLLRRRVAAATPFDFSAYGPLLWYDSAPANFTVNSNGTGGAPTPPATFGRALDLSGNARHASQGTAGNRLTLYADGFGGTAGDNDYHLIGSAPVISGGFALHMVLTVGTAAAASAYLGYADVVNSGLRRASGAWSITDDTEGAVDAPTVAAGRQYVRFRRHGGIVYFSQNGAESELGEMTFDLTWSWLGRAYNGTADVYLRADDRVEFLFLVEGGENIPALQAGIASTYGVTTQ